MSLIDEILSIHAPQNIEELAKEFAYEGFNVLDFYKHLKTIEKNVTELHKDMSKLCVFMMIRGPNIKKQLGRSSANAKRDINFLVRKYAIADNIGNDRSSNVVTGGRILSCFPNLCSEIAELDYVRDPVKIQLPVPKKHRFFSAPAIMTTSVQFYQWMDWALEMDEIVNKENSDEEKVFNFGKIAYENSPFNAGKEELKIYEAEETEEEGEDEDEKKKKEEADRTKKEADEKAEILRKRKEKKDRQKDRRKGKGI